MHTRSFALLLVLLSMSFLTAAPPRAAGPAMRAMTYNIRYDNPADGPDAWPNRREAVVSALRFHKVDLLCLQEGLDHQVMYLAEQMGWTAFGVGRDDGRRAGEQAAILFDARQLKQMDGGHFWLSPTPEKPGKGWDAASIRIATWVKLRDREGRSFLVLNTHLDDQGVEARREGARLIARRVKALAQGLPVLLTGDFNVGPGSEVCRTLTEAGLKDSLTVSERPHHGPLRTFWGFNPARPAEGDRIDFVFVTPNIRVTSHGTLADLTPVGHFASDHLPVLAEIVLPGR